MRALSLVVLLSCPVLANGIATSREAPEPPVRMTRCRVHATVRDAAASVTVEQVFRNTTGATLEGTYLFPLPPDAAVGDFAMTVGDTLMKGEVLDAERAREVYESIVRRRKDPGLLEYCGRGLFRARVWPIPAKGEVTVRLTYLHVLPETGGALELRYPLSSDSLNRAPLEQVLVDVDVETASELKAVYSPTHAVTVARDGDRRARVVFESADRRADGDFLLYLGRARGEVGMSLLSSKPVGLDGTFLAVLAPRIEADVDVPKDVVYVVDTSGSMRGRKMLQAKMAVAQAVRLLRPGDRFNVVAFATDRTLFRDALVAPTEENVFRAEQWIAALDAAGGTALWDALEPTLALGDGDRLFLVVLITDGRPTVGLVDADGIVERVKARNRGAARVFTFGVGMDLDVALLDRIAEVTGGERDYLGEQENIGKATEAFFRRVDRPVVTDVTLDCGPGVSQVYPRRIPDLFAGGQVTVLGRYAEAGPGTFRLKGRRGGEEVEFVFAGERAAEARLPWLERLWAQRKVAFLLDEIRLHGENPELVEEAKRLAVLHSIVTPYTSGLVVEEGERVRFAGPAGGSFRGPSGGVPPGLREPRDPATDPPPPTTPGDAGGAAAGPAAPVAASKSLRDRKRDPVLHGEANVRAVDGKTFRRHRSGRWVDTAWDGETEPTKVKAFSAEYFALAAKDDRLARYLAIGDRVLFVHQETVYEIVPSR